MHVFLQEKLTVLNFLQGGFIFLNIVFWYDDPTYYHSPGRGIEFAHLIFGNLNPCKTLIFMRSIVRGLPILVGSLRSDDLT